MARRLVAGHCLVVTANTSMGFGELRHLRRQDVFLADDPPFVEVNGGNKNDYRLRSIPLNFIALKSMRWIIKRWEQLGGNDPSQFILPHHARRTPQQKADPSHTSAGPIFTEPMGQIYRAARAILKDAGLAHLDPYDMRSHAITKLLSDPTVSDQIYTEIVGHVGNAMKRRYSKQRMENKRGAMDAMCKAQVELCEQEVETEVAAGTQEVQSEVRASMGLPENPVQTESTGSIGAYTVTGHDASRHSGRDQAPSRFGLTGSPWQVSIARKAGPQKTDVQATSSNEQHKRARWGE